MSLQLETDEMRAAYEKIRMTDDIKWVAFGYKKDNLVGVIGEGQEFDGFVNLCAEDARLYGFASFNTGDELSIRKKFVFISWIGERVPPKKKAAVSTHKSEIKRVVTTFAIELQVSAKEELKPGLILAALKKAGGADYGKAC